MEIYLDNSATTKPIKQAIEACVFAMEAEYGNPSSLHRKGFTADLLFKKAQSQLACALNCDKSEIVFTSGATESNNLAIIGGALAHKRRGNKIITTAIEHPSVLNAFEQLKHQGFEVVYINPLKNGCYSPDQFYEEVDENTILVSAMLVNNETGLVLPINEIGSAVKRKNPNTLVHVDAVQGFLKLPIKLKNSSIDLMSVSGHKVCAPKGIGALFVRRGVRILPILYGGGQQNGLRSGTESVPLACAFGAAVEAQKEDVAKMALHYSELNKYLSQKLSPNPNFRINFAENTSPHIMSIWVKGVRSEILLHFLEQKDIYVSSGSACAKGKHSYVLSALGLCKEISDETIRVSFGQDTTTQMLDIFAAELCEGINTLAKKR